MKKLISVKNLKVKFLVRSKVLTAIRNISFDIYDGEIVAIVGESGSGKSVFTKTFTNMLDSNGWISSGSIMYYPSEEAINDPESHIRETTDLVSYHRSLLSSDTSNAIAKQFKSKIKYLKKKIENLNNMNEAKLTNCLNKLENKKTILKEKNVFSSNTNKIIYQIEKIEKSISKIENLLEMCKDKNLLDKKIQLLNDEIVSANWGLAKIKKLTWLKRKQMKKLVKILCTVSSENKEISIEEKTLYEKYFSKKIYMNEFEILTKSLFDKILAGENFSEIEIHEWKKEWSQIKSTNFINRIRAFKNITNLRGATIATIFQDPMTSLNPLLSVGFQISEVIRKHTGVNKSEAKQKAIELLKKVGIRDAEKRYKDIPGKYSGGMRQRVVIAIALACEPRILICDEPTTALDVTIQAQILDLIKELQKEFKFTTIFITHDLGVVANIADRVAVMYAGQIIEYGKTEEIFYEPKHPYTWALLSSLPQLGTKGEELYSIKGTPPSLFKKIQGDAYAPRNDFAMKVDYLYEPPMFQITETHFAKTWLLDKRSKNVSMPEKLASIKKNERKMGE